MKRERCIMIMFTKHPARRETLVFTTGLDTGIRTSTPLSRRNATKSRQLPRCSSCCPGTKLGVYLDCTCHDSHAKFKSWKTRKSYSLQSIHHIDHKEAGCDPKSMMISSSSTRNISKKLSMLTATSVGTKTGKNFGEAMSSVARPL